MEKALQFIREKLQVIRANVIKHWLKGTVTAFFIIILAIFRDLWLSNGLGKIDITLIISTFISLMFVTDYIEKITINSRIINQHYPKSFIVVKEKILPEYIEKSKSRSFKSHNNKRDKIIKSPVDYTYETLSGNEAPIFRPNEKYLEEIFDDDITHIVSLTSENPNMWLDPTLNFYFVNTIAVSLLRKFNSSGKSKLIIKDFANQNGYHKYFNNQISGLLDSLKKKQKPVSFEFIRFFLYRSEQEECLKDTIFPSLKASQDLFRLNSFFINKDNIKSNLTENELNQYKEDVERIWNYIKDSNRITDKDSIEIINRRIKNEIPEFLILYKDDTAIIHTYVNGNAYKTSLTNTTINGINYLDTINNLISFIATYRINNNGCDWVPRDTEHLLNSKKSYIDWE